MIWRWAGNIEYDTWWCVMQRFVPQRVTLLVEFYFCVCDRLSRHTALSDSWSLAGTFVPFFWLRGSHGANVSETVEAFMWPTGSSKHYESSGYPVPTRADFGPVSQSEYDEYVAHMTSLDFFQYCSAVLQRKKWLYLIFICTNVQPLRNHKNLSSSFWSVFIFLLASNCSLCAVFLDIDMKKDIEVLIAEERAEIISKYNKVNYAICSYTLCGYVLN